jgi:glyoxylase-like metal-dependent hydrolase (beta-lactamase superfamily II)
MRNAVDNCLWTDLGDGVLVVDALEDVAMGPLIAEDVQATAGKPLRWVVNTHGDRDHIACNEEWAAAGAVIIAHETIAEKMAGRPGCPTVTFQQEYTLDGGLHEAIFRWLGGSHSSSDTVVYIPHRKIICVGDLFAWGLIPIAAYEPVRSARLVEVLRSILEYDADIVVCGHGPVASPAHIRRWLAYYEPLRDTVAALAARGLTAEEIEEQCPPPDDMRDWWRFVDWKHNQNIRILMGEKIKRE